MRIWQKCNVSSARYLVVSQRTAETRVKAIGKERSGLFFLWARGAVLSWDGFFLPEPVAFRRVYGLESYSRTSGESNRHRKSASTARVMPYQLHHEDDCRPVLGRHCSEYGMCYQELMAIKKIQLSRQMMSSEQRVLQVETLARLPESKFLRALGTKKFILRLLR